MNHGGVARPTGILVAFPEEDLDCLLRSHPQVTVLIALPTEMSDVIGSIAQG